MRRSRLTQDRVRGAPRALRARLLAGFLVAALTGAAASGPVTAHDAPAPGRPASTPALSAAPALPAIKPAPDFVLRATTGEAVRLSELRGRIVLVSFIYTQCTTACPLLTQRLALLRSRLRRTPGAAGDVHFLSITVDPTRDSAAALQRYARHFGAPARGWQFLRDEPERLAPVLAAYDEWTRPEPSGDIDHPARLYLIDRAGSIREIYSLSFFDERQAYLDIQALRREHR
ncbi:MAG TPA: SCO family protein [Methylomirabilota bacterium]|nr:SCO family protein [Methylomirabilota bacterium]